MLKDTTSDQRLETVYQDKMVFIEFESDGVLKDAIGRLQRFGADYLELSGPNDLTGNEDVIIRALNDNNCKMEEVTTVDRAIIKKDDVCAVGAIAPEDAIGNL